MSPFPHTPAAPFTATLPTLRLVRISIGPHRLDGLKPGQWRKEPL